MVERVLWEKGVEDHRSVPTMCSAAGHAIRERPPFLPERCCSRDGRQLSLGIMLP